MTYKLSVLLYFFFAIFSSSDAKNSTVKTLTFKTAQPPVVYVVKNDSAKVIVRKINRITLKSYAKDADFNYRETTIDETWWDRMWEWIWHVIENLFSSRRTSTQSPGAYVKFAMMALLIGLIIWGIIKAIGINNIFTQDSKQVSIPYSESLENIHEIAFGAEIEKAISQRNYRLAVRLLYLQSLKLLNDYQLINWQIEKTNSTYLNELTNSSQRQSFNILTRRFEYVWYGDFPVDGESFKHIEELFTEFKKMLS